MSIGLKIKDLASQRKITLPDLAKKLGKTKQAIYDIVEKDDINTALLRKVAEVFNVPMSYFFDDTAPGSAIASGKNSIAAVNSEVNSSKALEEKVRLLEQLLEEKERTIQILMSQTNKQKQYGTRRTDTQDY